MTSVRRSVAIVVVFLAATVAGLYFATQLQLAYPPSVRSPSWGRALLVNLVFYWLWGAAVPLVWHLARRFPLDQQSWRGSLPAHLAIAVPVTVVQILLIELMKGSLFGWKRGVVSFLVDGVTMNFHSSYPTYWVILLAVTAWRAAALQSRLAEARLEALRGQLQPHFLFNTLNSVSSLMYRDIEAADTMIARLSDLLRLTLRGGDEREIPLRRELDLLGRYLDIERIRFEERLRVHLDIDAEAETAMVPPFLLQPIVENAVRHAIAARPEGGRLEIAARLDGERLILSVADDGPGLPEGGGVPGVGLSNTRARLAELYGAAARLDLDDTPGGGLTVTVTLPRRA
jgi:two-component system, LytTR family, sensor kinase